MSGSLYVYAVVPARAAGARGAGIDGRPVRTVAAGAVAAVVHEHDGAPYGGSDDEVRRRALEHNAVVERLWQEDHAVLPMSFDVIVGASEVETAEERLARWLEEVATAADERLRSVAGRVELRVDIGLDLEAAAADDAEVAGLRAQAAGSTPGVARLLRKRVLRREREVAERLADALYPDLRRRLAQASADLVESERSTPEPGEVLVISVSLLVDEEAVPQVGGELSAVAQQQPAARIRFYGPWPPYSFAELAGAGPDTAGD